MRPSDFDPVQLRLGTQVEMEHTDNYWTAREIAMDHLVEYPDYYQALAKMEKELKLKKNAPSGLYVLIQEPRREGVYVRCRDADQCLRVVERELKENMVGTRITMFRKKLNRQPELLAVWHIEKNGAKRYAVER